jgi:uncharacterized protein
VNGEKRRGSGLLMLALVFYGLLLLVAVGVTALWGDFATWFPQKAVLEWGVDLVIGFLVGNIVVEGTRLLSLRLRLFEELTREFGRILGILSWQEVFWLALASGIAEEALFRAALQPLWGLTIASLCFGLAHVGPGRRFLPWTVFAVAFGFLAGALVEWRSGLLLPAVVHITVNGRNLYWISKNYGYLKARESLGEAGGEEE